MKPVATADIAVVAAIDARQLLHGRVLSGPAPGRFYALVEAAALAKWRASPTELPQSESKP